VGIATANPNFCVWVKCEVRVCKVVICEVLCEVLVQGTGKLHYTIAPLVTVRIRVSHYAYRTVIA